MSDVYILAIETSCDETSMAIVKNGKKGGGTYDFNSNGYTC